MFTACKKRFDKAKPLYQRAIDMLKPDDPCRKAIEAKLAGDLPLPPWPIAYSAYFSEHPLSAACADSALRVRIILIPYRLNGRFCPTRRFDPPSGKGGNGARLCKNTGIQSVRRKPFLVSSV